MGPAGQAVLQVEGEVHHPDTRLPPGFQERVIKNIRDGNFSFQSKSFIGDEETLK